MAADLRTVYLYANLTLLAKAGPLDVDETIQGAPAWPGWRGVP